MKKLSPARHHVSILSAAVIALMAVSLVGLAHAQTGTLLRSFDVPALPPHPIYFTVGVAFDGTNLYYSMPSTSPNDVFYTTTTGTLLDTLNLQSYAGALAWDGTALWVAPFDASATTVDLYHYTVGPRPQLIGQIDITSIILGNGSCAAISGLYYQANKGFLWVTPNACVGPGITNRNTTYVIDTSGNLVKMVSNPIATASLTKVNDNFYLTNKPLERNGLQGIVQTDENGNIITSFGGSTTRYEQSYYDPITFAPTCALWITHFFIDSSGNLNGRLEAYEIPCGS